MPLITELKFRFLYVLISFCFNFFVIFFFIEEVVYLLTSCFMADLGYFIYSGLLDILSIYFNVSFFFSFLFSFIILFYHFWFLFRPGLYNFENSFLSLSLLYIFAFYFVLFFTFNSSIILNIWLFIKSLNSFFYWKIFEVFFELNLQYLITFLIFFIKFIITFFSLPLFLHFLIFFNFLSLSFLIKFRKFFYFFLVFLVFSVTFFDFFTQFIIFVFIVILFEWSIFFYFILKNK